MGVLPAIGLRDELGIQTRLRLVLLRRSDLGETLDRVLEGQLVVRRDRVPLNRVEWRRRRSVEAFHQRIGPAGRWTGTLPDGKCGHLAEGWPGGHRVCLRSWRGACVRIRSSVAPAWHFMENYERPEPVRMALLIRRMKEIRDFCSPPRS